MSLHALVVVLEHEFDALLVCDDIQDQLAYLLNLLSVLKTDGQHIIRRIAYHVCSRLHIGDARLYHMFLTKVLDNLQRGPLSDPLMIYPHNRKYFEHMSALGRLQLQQAILNIWSIPPTMWSHEVHAKLVTEAEWVCWGFPSSDRRSFEMALSSLHNLLGKFVA